MQKEIQYQCPHSKLFSFENELHETFCEELIVFLEVGVGVAGAGGIDPQSP